MFNNPFMFNNQNMQGPMGMMQQFQQQFQQFRQSFQGDPKQEIDRRLASGEITQDQVNAAFQKARQMGLIR